MAVAENLDQLCTVWLTSEGCPQAGVVEVSLDEASGALSDNELAALDAVLPWGRWGEPSHHHSAPPPGSVALGRSPSGTVMAYLVPATLAGFYQAHVNGPLDEPTDPVTLERHRERREVEKEQATTRWG